MTHNVAAVEVAISILNHRFQSPTKGATEGYVEALHAIIADVIDLCGVTISSLVDGSGRPLAYADLWAQDVIATLNDYVAIHYGVEEFGL
jgi:hypothetical protein